MMCSTDPEEVARVRLCNARIRNENYLLRSTLKNLTDNPYTECSKVLSSVINHCTKARGQRVNGAADAFCCSPSGTIKQCRPVCTVCCDPVCCTCVPKCSPYQKLCPPPPPPCPAPCTKICTPSYCKPNCTCYYCLTSDPCPKKCFCDCCRPPLWEPKKRRRGRARSLPRAVCSPCDTPICSRPCSPPCLTPCPRPCSPCLPSECSRPCAPRCCPDPCRTSHCSRPCPSTVITRCYSRSPPALFPRAPKSYACLRYPVSARSFNYCRHNNRTSNDLSMSNNNQGQQLSPRDNCRVGAGCSAGTCGGYTPSGWNKLLTKHSLECTDPCCRYCCPPCPPCPNCTGPCPCAINCTCPCPFPRPRSSSPCSRSKKKSPNASENASNSWAPSEDTQSNSCCQRPSTKILGELAFQLERRILDYVFGLDGSKRRRFYGYTVSNICEMMEKECKHSSGTEDQFLRTDLAGRLKKILSALHARGYKIDVHGEFAQETVNKYGLLSSPPDPQTIQEFGLQDPACIASLISQLATGPAEVRNLTILLNSLKYLAKCDGRPLFVW